MLSERSAQPSNDKLNEIIRVPPSLSFSVKPLTRKGTMCVSLNLSCCRSSKVTNIMPKRANNHKKVISGYFNKYYNYLYFDIMGLRKER